MPNTFPPASSFTYKKKQIVSNLLIFFFLLAESPSPENSGFDPFKQLMLGAAWISVKNSVAHEIKLGDELELALNAGLL